MILKVPAYEFFNFLNLITLVILRGLVDFEVIKEMEIFEQEIDDEIMMSQIQDSKILKDQMRNWEWLSVEIKPKICKLVKNLFRPFHMKEHVRIIDKNKKSGPCPRNLRRRNPFLFFWL